uniref:LEDGF domain-containing protein n=1 Tax=Mesocestoides corti TaxID=53468 RepID=A0A5K3EL60_MESCO
MGQSCFSFANRLKRRLFVPCHPELGTEARLHFIDRAIKMSLIRGQEDIPTCLQRLESLEKLELTLPVLVKCNSIVETIRKCCRYKPSMDVKIAALKVFNRFLKVQENASKDEMEKAHAELMENNKRLQPSVSHLGPKSVEDLFQCVRRPSVGGDQAKSPAPQPTSPPPTQSASTSSDVASTAETLPQPPPPPPLPPPTSPSVSPPHPTSSDPSRLSPPRCPLDQSSIGVHNTTTSPQPENTGSGGSDSEGLAPSLGGLDGEESTDSDEEPVAPLLSKSSYNPFNVEATMAAVKQAFLQRTRDKSSAEPSNANKPQTASESDAYVPQPLHSCSVPLPAYVPCPTFPLSAFIPTSIAAPSTSSYQAPPPPPFPPFAADLSRPPPPMPPQEEFRHVDSRVSPEIRRRPTRQRAPSPHALPHPLEHYQKFLNNGESHPPPSITTRPLVQSGGDDLDTRIARLLEAAAPHLQQHQQPPSAILSPPPPPPPLPPSQNLILAHRPQPNVLAEPPAYTPDSPVQDGINGGQDFDPLNVWPPQRGRGGEDVYKTLDI